MTAWIAGLTGWNYLRVRGEYFSHLLLIRPVGELPPRARRIRSILSRIILVEGTTSACAENTSQPSTNGSNIWNYLRVRGEYQAGQSTTPAPTELPPRARRIPSCFLNWRTTAGTTSACAENTLHIWKPCVRSRNYLRVRGEYPTTPCRKPGRKELPPRARRIP